MNRERKRKVREADKLNRARESQMLEANAARLKTMTAGFSRTPRESAKSPYVWLANPRVEPLLPAKVDTPIKAKAEPKLQKSVLLELESRNKMADNRRLELQSRVAPLYNKGGYQFVSDLELQDLRAGKNRRRT